MNGIPNSSTVSVVKSKLRDRHANTTTNLVLNGKANMNKSDNEFRAGFIVGFGLMLIAAILMWKLVRNSYEHDAITAGVGKYILETPTSTKATFVWVTNKME